MELGPLAALVGTWEGDQGAFSYRQTTTIDHARTPEPLLHTDTNTLYRVG
jgi:hypothetical protein